MEKETVVFFFLRTLREGFFGGEKENFLHAAFRFYSIVK